MNDKITVYANTDIKKFLIQIFPDKIIEYRKISDFKNSPTKHGCNIVLVEDIPLTKQLSFDKSDIVIHKTCIYIGHVRV